jgi:hypothetical protein
MPEDLPKAVIVLLWLLIGTIIFGYLLMEFPYIYSFSFVVVFFGGPVLWNAKKKKEQPQA